MQITYASHSSTVKSWLRAQYFEATGKSMKSEGLKELVGLLEAKAIHGDQVSEAHRRIAEQGDTLYVDIGDDIGSVVAIDANGWQVARAAPIKFLRPRGYGTLPLPSHEGDINLLKDGLKLATNSWPLVLAFVISAFHPHGPYYHLMIEGEHGSGKSFATSILKSIIDPSTASRSMLPKNERDLMVAARMSRVMAFDNMSYIQGNMSDALCVLATGGGMTLRSLFTDQEPCILQQTCPVIMNGITSMIHRPDLMDRTIPVFLTEMPAGARRPEEELKAELNAQMPRILGGLFDVLSMAMRNRADVIAPTTLRMADCAKWLLAAEPATGLPEGTLIAAIEGQQKEFVAEQMVTHPLVTALSSLLEAGMFDGYVGELHQRLTADVNAKTRDVIGQTPAHFSNALKRLKSSLRIVGIAYELGEKDRKGKPIKVWRDDRDGGDALLKRRLDY